MNIPEAIKRLKEFRDTVCNPVDFYAERTPHWRHAAQQLTSATIRALMPANAQPSLWAAKAERIARLVSAQLEPMIPGSRLFIAKEADRPNPSVTDISIAEIQRWVDGGIRGEEGGKNILLMEAGLGWSRKGRDMDKTTLQIAWRVWYSIHNRKGKWQSLRQHIIRYNMSSKNDPDDLMRKILEVWIKTLVPIARRDWKNWLQKQVAKLG
jgi:hypothetical protein